MALNINAQVPCNEEVKFFCVEYPALVKNNSKMLATLGDIAHIKEVYNDATKRLDLTFRPKDPCCKPVCADRHQCTSLLLRVTKYRRRTPAAKQNEKPEIRYKQSICGVVDHVYKFSTMCDYQFLPVKKEEASDRLINMMPFLAVDKLHKDNTAFNREAPLFIPPPTFSRLDTPQDYLYRDAVKLYRNMPQAPTSKIGVSRPRRFHNAICLKFEDETPTKCLPGAEVNFKMFCGHLEHKKSEMEKMFQEQPVWSKTALLHKLNVPGESLKYLLPLVAYYCITGPWRSLWIRFGYDPKKDPNARKYQLVDFRLRQGLHTPHIPIKAKRSTYFYKLPNLLPKSKPLTSDNPMLTAHHEKETEKAAAADKADLSVSEVEQDSDTVKEATYIFKPGRLPAHRQMFYMACNILLPEAQEIIHQQQVPGEVVCTKENGWFKPNTCAQVRDVISKEVFKTISLLKISSSQNPVDGEGPALKKKKRRSQKFLTVKTEQFGDAVRGSSQEDELETEVTEEDVSEFDEESASEDDQVTSVARDEEGIYEITINDDEYEDKDDADNNNNEWFDDEDFDEDSQILGAAALFADMDAD